MLCKDFINMPLKDNSFCINVLKTIVLKSRGLWFFIVYTCICSAQSRNRYNSRIVLRKVGILTLLRKVGIVTLRKTILELLLRKVGIGTKLEYPLLYKVGIETKLEYRLYCNLFQVVFYVLPT